MEENGQNVAQNFTLANPVSPKGTRHSRDRTDHSGRAEQKAQGSQAVVGLIIRHA
jgi:hypothetical protein